MTIPGRRRAIALRAMRRGAPCGIVLASAVIGLAACAGRPDATHADRLPAARPAAEPYLGMPERADGAFPALLSQTGAFLDTPTLTPAGALIPYQVNTPLWSDGATKRRWISVPHRVMGGTTAESRISPTVDGEWYFPRGTVLIKHFELADDERDPAHVRRLETRLLVCASDGHVYGVTYRWRADGSDAERCDDGADDDIAIATRDGGIRTQRWHHPSRSECLLCHNQTAGGVLGVKTRQLNRSVSGHDGAPGNQLVLLNRLGLFEPEITEAAIATYPRTVALDDTHASLEMRARSYLDANCSHCHRPGALPFLSYDARFDTPLDRQNLIWGRVATDCGIERPRYIKPRDPWRSMVLIRQERTDLIRMPPLGRTLVDGQAVAVMRAWIDSLPGDPALAPPELVPAGGRFIAPLAVRAQHEDPQAELHYTLDGSAPDQDSPLYSGPFTLGRDAVVRLKAYRRGWAGSLPVTGRFEIR